MYILCTVLYVYTSWEKHGYFLCDHIYALITYYNNMCLDVTIYVFSMTLCAFVCECGCSGDFTV